MHPHLLRRAGIAGILLLPVPVLHAAANVPMAVSPVVVRLDTATEFSAVLVGNRGDHATGVEVEVVRVRWVDGQEQYQPTDDFIVSPPTFRLSEKKERLVRFRYAGPRHDTEDFFRLFIRQLPEETTGNQIDMVVSLGVPIFVAPLVSRAALAVAGAGAPGTAYLLRNSGNVTLNIVKLAGKSCAPGLQKTLPRLSPGQQVALDADLALCATTAQTDQGLIALMPDGVAGR